jgi:hypothetical protein
MTSMQAPPKALTHVQDAHWSDDLFERRQYADFLTRYIDKKCTAGQPGLVIALDATWGLGKSFFIERWSKDLILQNRPVAVFDAWENDATEQPAISFMAELQKAIEPIYESLPRDQALKRSLKEKTSQMMRSLRRATIPTAKVLGQAIFKKVSGEALEDFVDTLKTAIEEPVKKDESQTGQSKDEKSVSEVYEKGLDSFFESSLEGHIAQKKAVHTFKNNLEELVVLLNQNRTNESPLFIFVDELDRCRPDYAINLLEGIKHLFTVKGVVFVVSTNLNQLSKAVGAVYGPQFNGYMYLKRFFDFEYKLPEPTRSKYIQSQYDQSILSSLRCVSGLDPNLKHDADPVRAFALVADAMELDLRSIKRILTVVEAALSALPKGSSYLALWLFFLAAVRHIDPIALTRITSPIIEASAFRQICTQMLTGGQVYEYASVDENGRIRGRKETSLESILIELHSASFMKGDDLGRRVDNMGDAREAYPNSLYYLLAVNWPNMSGERLPISGYGKLLNSAGHITA